jgi:segregation and condensation protein A
MARLRSLRRATFRQLIADCVGTYELVARFLAILELYRDGRVSLDQAAPLGDILVSWADKPEPPRDVRDEYSEQAEDDDPHQVVHLDREEEDDRDDG